MATPLPPSPFLATPDRSEWDGTASHARILNAPQPATTAVKVTYQSCDGGRTRRQLVMTVTNRLKGLVKQGGEIRWTR